MNELPQLIDIKELAEYLECSSTIAYRIVKDRRFPAFKVGGKWLIDKDKLSNWILAQMQMSQRRNI